MENLVSKIENQKTVKNYGITEVYFFNGEFFITSNYELPYELTEQLELELSK